MGVQAAAFAFADCACCPPGKRRETVTHTEALPSASRHAFLHVARPHQLPREVLERIFSFAVLVEQRVQTTSCPNPASATRRGMAVREQPAGSDNLFAFAGLCLDADDAPP